MLRELFAEILPNIELLEFVDTDLLAAVTGEGRLAPAAIRRVVHLARCAEQAGAEVILSACSVIGPAIPSARAAVHVPIVQIDEPMVQHAVQDAEEIGVLATLDLALDPVVALLEQEARAAGRQIYIHPMLVPEAFAALEAGRQEGHDEMVVDAALELAAVADVIVPAQVELARLVPRLRAVTGCKVFDGPRLAVEHIKYLLAQMPESREPALAAGPAVAYTRA